MVKVSLFTNTHTNQTRPSSLDLAVRGMIVSADKITESNRPPSLRFDCPCPNSQPRADPHTPAGQRANRMAAWDGTAGHPVSSPALAPGSRAQSDAAHGRAGEPARVPWPAAATCARVLACLPFRSPSPDICPIIRHDGQTSRHLARLI